MKITLKSLAAAKAKAQSLNILRRAKYLTMNKDTMECLPHNPGELWGIQVILDNSLAYGAVNVTWVYERIESLNIAEETRDEIVAKLHESYYQTLEASDMEYKDGGE